jgi:hypothetical protein
MKSIKRFALALIAGSLLVAQAHAAALYPLDPAYSPREGHMGAQEGPDSTFNVHGGTLRDSSGDEINAYD